MAEPEAPPKDDAEDTPTADEAPADEEARGGEVKGNDRPEPSAREAKEDEPEPSARGAKSDPPAESAPPAEGGPRSRGDDGDDGHGPAWLSLAIAVLLPVVFFFVLPPLTKSGLWDPYELNVADLARRVALNLHGATNLALEGADNSLPHLNDLGRPQLPFTSIALGFKLFGLHEWAGRAPLALWGVLGVLATYGFVARLVDRRAAVFSAVALTTMPLYFVQARTMLGDVVMMAALAMSFGGLAVAVFGAREGDARDRAVRAAWLALAAVGLVAGYYTRGSLIGVGVPALAVGAAYLVAVTNGQRLDSLAHAAGGVAALVGVSFAIRGAVAIGADHFDDMTVPIAGALMKPPSKYPTFDFMIGHLAPALAPWSAFVPFAVGRMFTSPTRVRPDAFARESQTRLVLLLGAAVAYVAHGWMAPRADLVTFSAPAVMAAVCGVALRDYERGAHPSVAVGVGTMVLLGLMHHELHKIPEKAFHAFSVASGATFPESFKAHSIAIWTVVLVGFAGIAFLTWVERDPEREPFEPKGYLRVLLALRDAWDGMLALAYFAMVAGASLAGLAVWIGTRQHAKWLPQLSSQMRDAVLNAWWVTAFAPLVAIFAVYFWCDVWVWAFDRAPRGRGTGDVASGLRAVLGRSATRGFEPFEDLAQRLKEGRLRETVPKLVLGKLAVDHDKLEDGVGPVALFVLAPLMYLQVPAVLFLALWQKVGLRPLVAGALAIPSGVALFLVLGVVGDLFRGSRAAFLALFGATVSAVLCFSYYPALANQLSPKEIFESYQRTHKGAEPLALFGVGGRTAAYYAGGQPLILKDTQSAYEWLMGGDPGARRFLAVRAEELSRLNRAYRERTANGDNLPVLDARSSQIVLVASSLRDSEKNQNPLSRIVLTAPPTPQRKLEVVLDDRLQVLGYDIADSAGRLVDRVAPGKKYHMRTYFKVLAPLQSEWDMFIHVDGFRRRHNGDHKICENKYPMSLWLKDDIIMDDHEFSLEPNFSPGAYNLWFGLFVGETRMKVVSGTSDGDNRVNGGALRVQ
ncbi:MAG: glycosyltransferase family 39 protein [Labilithrix sp.]|nr:glycosyltransferase family 39 protein [Labilithrix sp.]